MVGLQLLTFYYLCSMNRFSAHAALLFVALVVLPFCAYSFKEAGESATHKTLVGRYIVVDSVSWTPLAGASVFDRKGHFIGQCGNLGKTPRIDRRDYPVTIRIIGYKELRLPEPLAADTIFLAENATELDEVIVSGKQHKVLHMLGYVREYSTLTTYTDTVFLFREKMVDFMLTPDRKTHFKGWDNPRVLKSKSYYRFTDKHGLDSVSGEGNYHFSWSDWVSPILSPKLTPAVRDVASATDTVQGRNRPTEIWTRRGDKVSVAVNVLADTASRRWVPRLSGFFNDGLEFDSFRVRFNYANVESDTILPIDLTGYSFNIESEGRGRKMFRFNRRDEQFYVTTYSEVYIVDKEYITVGEARKWVNKPLHASDLEILEPEEAPELQPDVLALISRVENVDKDAVRVGYTADSRLMSPYLYDWDHPDSFGRNFRVGRRALFLLKQVTGISAVRSHRNTRDRWRDFRQQQIHRKDPAPSAPREE